MLVSNRRSLGILKIKTEMMKFIDVKGIIKVIITQLCCSGDNFFS